MMIQKPLTDEEIEDVVSEPMSIHLHDAHAIVATLLEAQRYRKLKAELESESTCNACSCKATFEWVWRENEPNSFDAAVDAIPGPQ